MSAKYDATHSSIPLQSLRRRGLHASLIATVHPYRMKTMICRDLGGSCDQELTADSWDAMVAAMTKHVIENHPDVAKEMETMHAEDPKKWGAEMKPKWDATVAK